MVVRKLALNLGVCAALLSACGPAGSPEAEATANAPEAVEAQPVSNPALEGATGAPALPGDFTVEQVPLSTASMPPFPLFAIPDGLVSIFDAKDKDIGFDRQHFIAGKKVVAVEGKVFHDGFQLQPAEGRRYSEIEFHRNYENAITALGGRKISDVQFAREVVEPFGGRDKVEAHYKGACVAEGCRNESYLIRQGDKEFWINVSTGRIPLHGYVTVLERQGMKQSLGYLTADAMKTALDESGRVALYINFDFDRATLRPDGGPVIDEIAKLLRDNPTLKLSIEGHTDNVGAVARNRTLSADRAATVRQALIAKGVSPDRLTAKGFGADRPVADNATEDGRARNRRVELVKVP